MEQTIKESAPRSLIDIIGLLAITHAAHSAMCPGELP
jgi:hypothetical protein